MIEAERLLLRHFVPDDSQKIYRMSLEEGMRKWIPDQVYANEAEASDVLEFLISCYNEPDPCKKPFVLGIVLKTGELIGHAGLSPLGDEVEIGYAVEDKYQGNGYATEAVKALTAYGIIHFDLKSVTGVVDSDNSGSIKVLKKAGYLFGKEEIRNAFGRTGKCRIYRFNLYFKNFRFSL